MAAPQQSRRTGIIDEAGVVDAATEKRMNGWLLELEKKTGAQLRVLTIQTTGGRDIHSYALETAQRWRLGEKGEDNGVLVVVAVRDRKYYTVTGEGIEDTLPDLYLRRVGEQHFVPHFKRGDYGGGIYAGTVAIANRIAKDAGVQLSGVPPTPTRQHRSSRRGRRGGFSCFWIIVLLFVFGGAFGNRRRRGHGAWGGGGLVQGLLIGSILSNIGRGGGGWSSGSSSGGFGGFGGGGFGFGGGGSFGGGGAGGSW
ncbi:MAG: TPM domain-containing protein [Phycisphaerae bacterium]